MTLGSKFSKILDVSTKVPWSFYDDSFLEELSHLQANFFFRKHSTLVLLSRCLNLPVVEAFPHGPD